MPVKLVTSPDYRPPARYHSQNDFDETAARLSHEAGSLKLCDDKILRAKGYQKIMRMP